MPAGVTPVMAAADFLSMVRRNVMMHLGGAVADALGVRMHPDMLKVSMLVDHHACMVKKEGAAHSSKTLNPKPKNP